MEAKAQAKTQKIVVFLDEVASSGQIMRALSQGAKVGVVSSNTKYKDKEENLWQAVVGSLAISQGWEASLGDNLVTKLFDADRENVEDVVAEQCKALAGQAKNVSIAVFYPGDVIYHGEDDKLNENLLKDKIQPFLDQASGELVVAQDVPPSVGRSELFSVPIVGDDYNNEFVDAQLAEFLGVQAEAQVEGGPHSSVDGAPPDTPIPTQNSRARHLKAISQFMFFTSGPGIGTGAAYATSYLYHQNWLVGSLWATLAFASLSWFLGAIKWLDGQSEVESKSADKNAAAETHAAWLCKAENILVPMVAGVLGGLSIYMHYQAGNLAFSLSVGCAMVAGAMAVYCLLNMLLGGPEQGNATPIRIADR